MIFNMQLHRFRAGAIADSDIVRQFGNRTPGFRRIRITGKYKNLDIHVFQSRKALQQGQPRPKAAIRFDEDVARQQQKIHVSLDTRLNDFVKGVQSRIFKSKTQLIRQRFGRLNANRNVQPHIRRM